MKVQKGFRYNVLLLIITFVIWVPSLYAQGVWEGDTEIYRNGSLIVKIVFNYSTTSCANGKQHKFRYITEGPVGQYTNTINFSFDYKNCEGNPVTFYGTLNLADIKYVGNNEASTDAKFVGSHASNIKKASSPSGGTISTNNGGRQAPNGGQQVDPDLPQPNNTPPANNRTTSNPSIGGGGSTNVYTSGTGLYGKVMNKKGVALSGASVTYQRKKLTTNYNGTFTANSVSGKVKVKSKGYAVYKSKVTTARDLDITLQKRTKFHIGFALGLDMEVKPLSALETTSYGGGAISQTQKAINPFGVGFKIEVPIHPFIVQNFHWGFNLDYAWGSGVKGSNPPSADYYDYDYKYMKAGIAMELAFGARKFKFLGKYRLGYHSHTYSTFLTQGAYLKEVDFDAALKSETLMGGFRLFTHIDKRGKKSVILDLYGVFTRDEIWSTNTIISKNWLNNWQRGGGVTLWAPGKIKIDVQMGMVSRFVSPEGTGQFADKKFYTQIGILYNANWFK